MNEEPRAPERHSPAPTVPLAGLVERVRGGLDRAAETASAWTASLGLRFEMLEVRLMPSGRLADRVRPDLDDPDDWSFLRRPAILGFIALAAVAFGASLPSSPFKFGMAGTWFFGEPSTGRSSQSFLLLGLVATYGGLVLVIRVWYGLVKALNRRPGVPQRYLWAMFGLWMLPMLVVAPLFSRDVYSYAAQGEMMSHHINPYQYGPATLGSGSYPGPVDPLWANTPAPYGPLFLMIDGFFASASLHHELMTVILLRLLAVVGVGLVAYCIPKLARAYGRDIGPAFALAVLNPLVVLTLIGGAHNDAIMMGLLVAGLTAAKTKHPLWGIVLCTLAAAIKVPAALGAVYIAWDWLGPGLSWRRKVRPLVTTGLVAVGVMALLSAASGLGWGWVANLDAPSTVRNWISPSTGLEFLLSGVLHAAGMHASLTSVLTVVRGLGLLGAGVVAVYLLWNSERIGSLRAIGMSLLVFVVLGPVVQPWYLTWGLILLAPVVTGRLRTLAITLSAVTPFLGLPGGRALVSHLASANVVGMAVTVAVLVGVLLIPLGHWSTRWRWQPIGEPVVMGIA